MTRLAGRHNPFKMGTFNDADFTIGAEASNIIKVTVQLKDGTKAIAHRGNLLAYLSDDAAGDSVVATAPDGGAAIATNGLAIPMVSAKMWRVTSEASGIFDINITHAAGAKTVYLVLVMPDGALKVSTAVTFA